MSDSDSSSSSGRDSCELCNNEAATYNKCKRCKKLVCKYCLSKCPLASDGSYMDCGYIVCHACYNDSDRCSNCGSKHCQVKNGLCKICRNSKCSKCDTIDLKGSTLPCGRFECCDCKYLRLRTCTKCATVEDYLSYGLCKKCAQIRDSMCKKCGAVPKTKRDYCESCYAIVTCTNCILPKSDNKAIAHLGYCDTCFDIFELCCVCNRKIRGNSCILQQRGSCKCGDCVITARHK